MKRNLLSIAVLVVASAPALADTVTTAVSVPEPSTISLLAAGLIALGIVRRKVTK